jgi:hypothetical protein
VVCHVDITFGRKCKGYKGGIFYCGKFCLLHEILKLGSKVTTGQQASECDIKSLLYLIK